MEATRLTELFTSRLLIAAACFVLPAVTQFQSPLPGQQFSSGVPASVPSFVYYRDSKVPENLLFSPINTDYKEFRINRNLRDDVKPPVISSSLSLGGIPSNGFVLPDNDGFSSSLNNRFLSPNNNGFNSPIDNRFIPSNNFGYNTAINNGDFPPNNIGFNNPINNGFLLPSNIGFNPPTNNRFLPPYNYGFNTQIPNRLRPPSYNNLYPTINSGFISPNSDGVSSVNTNEFLSPNRQTKSLSEQVSLLRYANNYPQAMNQQDYDKVVTDLNPTVLQRQRNVANAGQLLYRQQTVGSKPFLTSDSGSVQREGGEVLPSSDGFLGQAYRKPIFVSAVGTPVSGVGQNPLYTGDSVQASKLDEASDVKGVKNPGGIPAPGRLPVSQDAYFSGPGSGYANNFGYSVYEDPAFSSFPPSLVTSRGSLAIGPGAYRGGFVNG